ncbi:MAG: hypothetical protein F6J93_31195 [Oscillatoria sp. SIO1A7]|nr:hypothetical protein [Oscillatoria sp. SIO1A7]
MGAWSMGHWALEEGKVKSEKLRKPNQLFTIHYSLFNLYVPRSPGLHAPGPQVSMPHAPCPMPHAQFPPFPIPHERCRK